MFWTFHLSLYKADASSGLCLAIEKVNTVIRVEHRSDHPGTALNSLQKNAIKH